MNRTTLKVVVYGSSAFAIALLAFVGHKAWVFYGKTQMLSSDLRVASREEAAFRIYRRGTPEQAEHALKELALLSNRSDRGRRSSPPNARSRSTWP